MVPKRYTLDNGLTVITYPCHHSPVVSAEMWVNVGSAYEKPAEYGISHLIEHMLFKGTKRRGVGEIAKEVERYGGDINAYTSFEQTVYKITIASRYLHHALDVLGDAISFSQFDGSELEKEKEVVLEEIKRSEDHPGHVIGKMIFELSFKEHPYRRPIIGYEESVRGFTRDDLIQYYTRWYTAKNMVLIVAGDFEDIGAVVSKKFGGIPGTDLPDREIAVEPLQRMARFSFKNSDVEECYMNMGFPIPEASHPDHFALDVLSIVLGLSDSSRLIKRLRLDAALVNSISAQNYSPKDPGLFFISATLAASNQSEVFQIIVSELNRLKTEDVLRDDIDKAKAIVERDFVFQSETMQGLVRKVGFFHTIYNDIHFESRYLESIRSITSDDIRRVATRYFDWRRLNVAALLPEAIACDQQLAEIRATIDQVSAIDGCGQRVKRATPDVERVHLPNGLRVILKPTTHSPSVSLRLAIKGGVRRETAETAGHANLVAEVLGRGTEKYSAIELARRIEMIGGSIRTSSGKNSLCVALDTISRTIREGMALCHNLVTQPLFDPEAVEKVKISGMNALRLQQDNLASLAFLLFAKTLYGDHPYGLNQLGTVDSIQSATPSGLKAFYDAHINPREMVLAIVGDYACDEMKELITEQWGEVWRVTDAAQHFQGSFSDQPRVVTRAKEKKQAHIVLGFPGISFTDDRRYPLAVLNAVLSGQGGRLFLNLRDAKSLAYSVSSMSVEGVDPGSFWVYIGTSPDKIDEALRSICAELVAVKETAVSRDELERAQNYLIGSYEIDQQDSASQATTLAYNELYGMGYDAITRYPEKILAQTPDTVHGVAGEILDFNRCVVAVVKPAAVSFDTRVLEGYLGK